MSSTFETGHAKNVANLETMIINITALGTAYNPTKPSIKLPMLNTQLVAYKATLASLNGAEPAYKNAVAARELAFEPFNKLVTRVYNALKATDASQQTKDNALTLVRKLQGRRAKKKLTDDELKELSSNGKDVVQISTSQMGYDNRLENFDKLIKLLSSVAAYNPNEADLKITTLTALLNDMKTKNTAVKTALVPVISARINRNSMLYGKDTGLYDTAMSIKMYLKSAFGHSSPQFKTVSNLKFTSIY